MRVGSSRTPRCIVTAGPNGAGKTTFAREFLPHEAGVIHFVNADLIASGLSPLRPELAARQGGRLLLTELNRLAKARKDFAFETTLSGRTYVRMMRRWKASGYRIELVFLWLPSIELALERIAARVRQGGHDVPRADVVRDSTEVWGIFIRYIGLWRISGPSTIIRGRLRDWWRLGHENSKSENRGKAICSECRTGAPTSRESGEKDSTCPQHTHLCVGEWQSRSQETLILLSLFLALRHLMLLSCCWIYIPNSG